MTATPNSRSEPPVVEQTEQLIETVGERLGRSVAGLRRGARRLSGDAVMDGNRPAVVRAEEVVQRLEGTLAGYAAIAFHNARRVAARAREEMEDIQAEADSMRRAPPSAPQLDLQTATKDELIAEAERRGITVQRADGKDGEPLVSDYKRALR
ncbi:hypothetical protein BH23GEM4_BH23GEM4_15700 [soil metagenome]